MGLLLLLGGGGITVRDPPFFDLSHHSPPTDGDDGDAL